RSDRDWSSDVCSSDLVLARVPGLNLVEEFALRLRCVVVLADDYCLVSLLLDLRLEPGEVGAAKHVAVHEDRPAPETGQGRDEEPGQAELGGFRRAARPCIDALQLRLHQGRN